MLSWAAENVELMWNPLPRPDPSRLDEWFLGGVRAGSQTLSRAVPSRFRQHIGRLRRSNTSCAGGNLLLPLQLQTLSLLVAVGASLRPPPLPRSSSLSPGGVMEPPPNPAASTSARGPETGNPEMEGNCSSGYGVRTSSLLAHTCKHLSAHRNPMLKHLSLLGLRVNWEKSKLVPTQRIQST